MFEIHLEFICVPRFWSSLSDVSSKLSSVSFVWIGIQKIIDPYIQQDGFYLTKIVFLHICVELVINKNLYEHDEWI